MKHYKNPTITNMIRILLSKTSRLRQGTLTALLFSTAAFIPGLNAQEPEDDQVFELSPFEVSEDSEIGYLATQTLSGTRMRSSLGDVAASIDVLTEEFLSDVGAMSMYDALDYVGNVDTWGVSGGISEAENQVWFSSPYMARGFITQAVTSDFITQGKAPLDFYNRSSFTVARGPNAILFGIGSPGGIVNASRKRPLFGKDEVEVEVRLDNYDSFRSTLDVSRELIDEKLAVRAAILYDDRKEFLEPAGWERQAIYGALTYRPFKKTSINLMAESGDEFRTFRYSASIYDKATLYANEGLTRGERRMALLIAGQSNIPIMNWDPMLTSAQYEIPGHPDINGTRNIGFTEDTAVWAYDETQLQGTSRQRSLDWQDLSFFMTQELFVPELQLELAYNRNTTEYLLTNTFGQFDLQIDPNEFLPNGDPNPNFGVPYLESDRSEVITEHNTTDTARATLSYQLDLNDIEILGIGLGRYNLMGLLEEVRTNSLFSGFRRTMIENINGMPANGNYTNANSRVRTRVYVQTDLTPEGANVFPYWVNDFTPINQNIDGDLAEDAWTRHTSPRDIMDTRFSKIAALQAYLWKAKEGFDRIILTAGYRHDRQTSQRKEYGRTSNNAYEGALWSGDPHNMTGEQRDAMWDGAFNYGVLGDVALTKEPTTTYSAIFKITEGLSVYYNYSDVVISASSLFTDAYGRFVGPTLGTTRDYGIRWSTKDNKLVTSLTFFETAANDQLESGTVRNVIQNEIDDIWEVADPNFEIHQDFVERWVTKRTDSSEGAELSLVANLTPGWSTRLSVSRIETIISSRLPIVDQYLAEFMPIWEQYRNEPLADPGTDEEYQTVGDAIDRVKRDVANFHALEGTVPNAQREWKVVFNTNYRFRDGTLEGFAVGGGVRWQSDDIVGYAYDENFIVDPDKPFKGEEILDVSGSLSYTTTIKGVWTRFQINIRNLFDNDGMFPRSAVDDLTGNPYYGRQQVREPRSFQFTTTLKF